MLDFLIASQPYGTSPHDLEAFLLLNSDPKNPLIPQLEEKKQPVEVAQ